MASALPPIEPLHILLLGKTGHGKSATGNSIVGADVFHSEAGGKAVTEECAVYGSIIRGHQLRVVDTPGSMDTRDPEQALMTLATAIYKLYNHIDVLMIVLNFTTRITDEEITCIEQLKALFGSEIVNFVLVIFTHGDNFEKERKKKKDSMTFRQFVQKKGGDYLCQFLEDCGNRYVLVNNIAVGSKARDQTNEILNVIEKMKKQNKGNQYSNSFWNKLGAMSKPADGKDHELYTTELTPEQKDLINRMCKGGDEDEDDVDEEDVVEVLDEMKKTDAECFPANATVMVPLIGEKRMKDLAVGEKVLTLSRDLSPSQTDIYLFGHSLEKRKATFVCLKTTSRLLKITKGHFIYTFTKGQMSTTAAKDIIIGDMLLTQREERCVPEEVTDIWETEEVGLYAPFTLEGSILVDGILASCYVDVLPSTVAHSLLWPVRQMYKMSPTTLAAISKTGEDGIPRWIRWCMDNVLL